MNEATGQRRRARNVRNSTAQSSAAASLAQDQTRNLASLSNLQAKGGSKPYVRGQVPPLIGEARFEALAALLDSYALENKAIIEPVDIAFTGRIPEFALAFARETSLNLTVAPGLNTQIQSNFADARPRDILLHLCRAYDLTLVVDGTILTLLPFQAPQQSAPPPAYTVSYDAFAERLTIDVQNITLDTVLRAIVRATGQEIVSTSASGNNPVSLFVGSASVEHALKMLAYRNELTLTPPEEENFYILSPQKEGDKTAAAASAGRRVPRRSGGNQRTAIAQQADETLMRVQLAPDSSGRRLLKVSAHDADLALFIKMLADQGDLDIASLGEITGTVSIDVEAATVDEVLNIALSETEYQWTRQNGVLLVGSNRNASLRTTAVVQLHNRTLTGVLEAIPKELVKNVSINPFEELNALVIDGPLDEVERVQGFISKIDRRVPVVTIELIIVDVQRNSSVSTGIEAGITQEPVTTGGIVFPDPSFTFSSKSVNAVLDLLSGNGIVNLGNVSPNFYVRLQAAEDNGIARVHSKPQLSTVNGHEATFTLGETRYFQIQRTTVQGGVSPVSLQDNNFQSVNADFTVRILPLVSGNGTVTLDIDVNQSDFIGQVSNTAPPAQVNRSFQSNIRVNDGDMVVLGGLESKSVEDSGRGVPLLSRVPVLKWLFSSRRKARDKSKLLIFVRPRVDF